jgi:hypothetical protein
MTADAAALVPSCKWHMWHVCSFTYWDSHHAERLSNLKTEKFYKHHNQDNYRSHSAMTSKQIKTKDHIKIHNMKKVSILILIHQRSIYNHLLIRDAGIGLNWSRMDLENSNAQCWIQSVMVFRKHLWYHPTGCTIVHCYSWQRKSNKCPLHFQHP